MKESSRIVNLQGENGVKQRKGESEEEGRKLGRDAQVLPNLKKNTGLYIIVEDKEAPVTKRLVPQLDRVSENRKFAQKVLDNLNDGKKPKLKKQEEMQKTGYERKTKEDIKQAEQVRIGNSNQMSTERPTMKDQPIKQGNSRSSEVGKGKVRPSSGKGFLVSKLDKDRAEIFDKQLEQEVQSSTKPTRARQPITTYTSNDFHIRSYVEKKDTPPNTTLKSPWIKTKFQELVEAGPKIVPPANGPIRMRSDSQPRCNPPRDIRGLQLPANQLPKPIDQKPMVSKLLVGFEKKEDSMIGAKAVLPKKVTSMKKHTTDGLLLNLMNFAMVKARSPDAFLGYAVKAFVGKGNNASLLEKYLRAKKNCVIEPNMARCQFLWTQNRKKGFESTPCGVLSKVSYKGIEQREDYSSLPVLNPEAMAEEVINRKLFKCANPRLLIEVFTNLVKCNSLVTILVDHVLLTNHLSGMSCISKKSLLTETLIRYCKTKKLDPFSIIPRTYLVKSAGLEEELARIIALKKAQDDYATPFIIKPGENSNRGNGIQMAYNEAQTREVTLALLRNRKGTSCVIIQSYIPNPLLYQKRKFDIRCYALVVKIFNRTSFYWYEDGYARTSSYDYNMNNKDNLMVHLTNEAVQVKNSTKFGSHEPGNKVYFEELDKYFASQPQFKSQGIRFIDNIVPEFKVAYSNREQSPDNVQGSGPLHLS